jgi:hypothetical protein
VRQIKAPSWYPFRGAFDNKLPLDFVEPFLVGDAEFVSENGGTRIKIKSVLAHSAANGRA